MFERVPTRFKLVVFAGVLLAGPITLFAFLLGGAYAGAAVLVALFFFFVILYMLAVRRYG